MSASQDELIDWLERKIGNTGSPEDLIEKVPGITDDDAYRLQFAYAQRKVKQGQKLIGYKAAHTSLAIQQEQNNTVSIGSILSSYYFSEDKPIVIQPGTKPCVEPEIAVMFKHDLAGPGVTTADAFRAIEAVFPAIEIVTPARGGDHKRSRQMGITMSKTSGGIIVGRTPTSPFGIDLRLEGVMVSVNGVPKRSATGVEAMGHPMNVVAAVANTLGALGQSLKAGMILLTGSLTNNIPCEAGDEVLIEFTRLGNVKAHFAA